MKTTIRENLDQPEQLEKLYRTDRKRFEKAFFAIYPTIEGHHTADFWRARLAYDHQGEPNRQFMKSDLLFLLLACLLAGILIKIPQLIGFDPDLTDYYMKNGGIILFLGLSAFAFLTKDKLRPKQLLLSLPVFALS